MSALGYAAVGAGPARAVINPARYRADLDRRLLGAFLEHLGRAIYTGVYEPGSQLADSNGFRTDVIAEVKGLGVPIMRYPGGNFVSGYNWLDGVGPKDKRPTVLERAWNSIETNQFGTNEFIEWCRLVGTEPLLGFNLGTGTAERAWPTSSTATWRRARSGASCGASTATTQPHSVKYWCMGNEMDGPWQMGHLTAREYGRKARDCARQIRVVDPGTQLIACGSSNTILPTYLVWDREVLEECYDQVDGISLHNYYGNTQPLTGNDSARYLAMNLDMERQIHEIAAVCDYVQGLMKSPKRLWLSFDEWNVWYRARGGMFTNGERTVRPAAAGGGLQPRRRAARGWLREHPAPPIRSRAGRVSRPDRQRHRPPRDERYLRAAAEHLLPLRVGAPLRSRPRPRPPGRVRRPTRSRPGACAPTSRATTRPLPGRGRDPRPEERAGGVLMLNRDLHIGAGAGPRLARPDSDARPGLRDADGTDLKAANTFDQPMLVAPRTLDAPRRGSHDLQASPAFVQRGAHRHDVAGLAAGAHDAAGD